ncbi:hypothetical protein ACIA8O_10015 [Kitasatospora sp. NPDC051853]|uniref:hypothetical protein n=1 Tax=Kitasatospora sp. NPDC051853 TaxID=3364058 RepID=UPI0037B25EB2
MSDACTDLGSVTAPSGVLVLGTAGWIDHWRETGAPLSVRAAEAVATGGGHLRDGEAEVVVVRAAADRPLRVRATTRPSLFDEEPTIAVLEVALGLPWNAGQPGPVLLGDLPVDRCGMVVGDASGLDVWTGPADEPLDGLADVFYWGRYEDGAHARFGGERIAEDDVEASYGWLDLPLAEAVALAAEIEVWQGGLHSRGVAVGVEEHTDFHRFRRAAWHRPLHDGVIEVGGCRVLGIDWDQGDYAVTHHGGRDAGLVYPVTLEEDGAGGTVLRWTVPPGGEG